MIDNLTKSEKKIVEEIDSFEKIMDIYETYTTIFTEKAIEQNHSELETFNISGDSVKQKISKALNWEISKRALLISKIAKQNSAIGQKLWELITPKISSEIRIEGFEINGIIDRLLHFPEKVVPVEIKTGKSSSTGVWEGHKIQVAAYIMLLKEHNYQTKEGLIAYPEESKEVVVAFNPFLRDEVLELIEKTKSIITGKSIPEITKSKEKCKSCGLKEECYKMQNIHYTIVEKQKA